MDSGVVALKRSMALQKIIEKSTLVADATGDEIKKDRVIALRERSREMSFNPKDHLYGLRMLEALGDLLEVLAADPPQARN